MLRSSESPLQGVSVKSGDTSRMKGVPRGMEGRQPRSPLALGAKKASGIEPGSGARERGADPRMSKSPRFDFGGVYALAEDSPDAFTARGAQQKADQSWQRYRAPGGRGKFCTDCGSPMKRTSRMTTVDSLQWIIPWRVPVATGCGTPRIPTAVMEVGRSPAVRAPVAPVARQVVVAPDRVYCTG